AFVTPPSQNIDGPALANGRIQQAPDISKELSLLNVQGSNVVLGNMLVVPIEQSLLYIQPLYVKASQNPVPELKKVIVVAGDKAIMRDTLQDALSAAIGAPAPPTLEQGNGATNGGNNGTATTPTPSAGLDQTTQQLYDEAQADFVAADDALKRGD